MAKNHKTIDNLYFDIELLNEEHLKYLSNFNTGSKYPEKGLGEYVRNEAHNEMLTGDGVSYVVIGDIEDKGVIVTDAIAFFTLSSSSIPYIYRSETEDIYEEFCEIPAVKIHMFAVNDKYQDVFFDKKPIAAWVFGAVIDLINKKSQNDIGIKAIYLHSLPSAKEFYQKNGMRDFEEYMIPFASLDDDCEVMYTFIRDVDITFECNKPTKLGFFTKLKKKIKECFNN